MVGIGELLWDILPNGRSLGGAPSNFAYHATLLGNRGVIASRVGNDELGHEALRELIRMGVEANYAQIDLEHLTGTVGVNIDGRGEPHFTVNPASAWDYLTLTHAWKDLAHEAQVICFGTLGQRCPGASATIHSFLNFSRSAALRIFDVNLRHYFFSAETLVSSLETANVVKFNSEELSVTARLLGLRGSGENELSRQLIGLYNLDLVALTRSEKGSLLFTERSVIEHKGYRVEVADTIGCGDAFTAALAHCLVRGLPLEEASEAANLMGAWVASRTGATPRASRETIEEILSGLKAHKN
jgi:fructokinase